MKRVVQEYLRSLNVLFSHFGCEGDYLVKSLIDYKWNIQDGPDITLISYWDDVSKVRSAVIVKKNGEPLIYKAGEFTMVIAIDCVKTAFLLCNSNLIY